MYHVGLRPTSEKVRRLLLSFVIREYSLGPSILRPLIDKLANTNNTNLQLMYSCMLFLEGNFIF